MRSSKNNTARRILLFHGSDLFDRSGTAVIYRRILPLLPADIEVRHICSYWNSAGDWSAIVARYERELPRIRVERLPLNRLMLLSCRISYRAIGRTIFWPQARFYSLWLAKYIRRFDPEIVWFSSDFLPFSHALLSVLIPSLQQRRLHVSMYDPLECWDGYAQCVKDYRRVMARADSFDVIGENLRARVQTEAPGRPVSILSDYVDNLPGIDHGGIRSKSELIGVIAGRLYDSRELQELVDLLAALDPPSRLDWYGSENDLQLARRVVWPPHVRLRKCELVPRHDICGLVRDADFGYLAMPSTRPEFARYSIPTKLVTYLEAGLPVLYHAPDYAEIDALNRSYRFGYNLSPPEGARERLADFLRNLSTFRRGTLRLATDRYDRKVVEAALAQIVRPRGGCAGS